MQGASVIFAQGRADRPAGGRVDEMGGGGEREGGGGEPAAHLALPSPREKTEEDLWDIMDQ